MIHVEEIIQFLPLSYLQPELKHRNCVHCFISPDLFASGTEMIISYKKSVNISDTFYLLMECSGSVGSALDWG